MAERAERADPELWETVKAEVTAGDKGAEAGRWSARKAQFAVQEYKRRGGRYCGRKDADNSLLRWGEEDWGTKSGEKSTDTGERYLPKKALEALSDEEYRSTTAKKRADRRAGRQFSAQPETVARKTALFRDGHGAHGEKTKADLVDEARRKGLRGYSRMSKDELARSLHG